MVAIQVYFGNSSESTTADRADSTTATAPDSSLRQGVCGAEQLRYSVYVESEGGYQLLEV